MYKKFGVILILCNLIIVTAGFSVKGIEASSLASTPAFQLKFSEDFRLVNKALVKQTSFYKNIEENTSGQRIVNIDVLERKRTVNLSEEDYQILLRIVEAEAGGEDENGKMLVANIVLNRVNSKKFPNTVKEVVFQKDGGTWQFSPMGDGRYKAVEIDDTTIAAVEKVLCGMDLSQGALYFAARKHADPSKMKWFDNHLTPLFAYGGHEFFK